MIHRKLLCAIQFVQMTFHWSEANKMRINMSVCFWRFCQYNTMQQQQSGPKDYWVPLESNPVVLSKFAAALGVPPQWGFSDCLGLDEELLAMVPQPCLSLLFLFPYSKMKAFKTEEREAIEQKGQFISPKVYFMKQLVGNACGTVAVVHSLANNAEHLGLEKGFFADFLLKTRSAGAEERGRLFGSEQPLAAAADSSAKDESAQTEAPEADAHVDSHFVCFTPVEGHLYELDGTKEFPVNHGPTTPESFLRDAAKVIRNNFIEKLKDDPYFSLIAFGAAGDG